MSVLSFGAVTGRFQPVHAAHLELFELALAEHDELIVAVTNPDPGARHEETSSAHRHTDEANPFSYVERGLLLRAALAGAGMAHRATIVPFDLTRPAIWPEYVPMHARHYVRVFSAWERQKAGWFTDAGYEVTIVDGVADGRITATEVRAELRAGRWHRALPRSVRAVLRELLAARGMERR